MARTVAIGIQKFDDMIRKNVFYVDKTHFIKEWWESEDAVTLITRPRRFGKTLNMSMLECFFSNKYAGSGHLFEGLSIWQEEKYRELQGAYPVIFLSFSSIKEDTYKKSIKGFSRLITKLYNKNIFLLEGNTLTDAEKKQYNQRCLEISEDDLAGSINDLTDYYYRYYGKNVIILLDEYDTPMQEAYISGYWDDMVKLMRGFFNATFKDNPYMERAVLTGITRVSRESLFSDFNNLRVVTTTSNKYMEAFGFTEEEVFAAMDEQGLTDKESVKRMYDGFIFGTKSDIYNPWSIINYLQTGKLDVYWVNTSSNGLVGKLIREGSVKLKRQFEDLLMGRSLNVTIDEQIVYNTIDDDESAVWSLLLASGYLKVLSHEYVEMEEGVVAKAELTITNKEVKSMFSKMVRGWFRGRCSGDYGEFVKALLRDDIEEMNIYMNRVALSTISYFDSANNPSNESEPEKFYHGFALGLLVELRDRYQILSNRESGFGRYDIMMIPKAKNLNGIVMEFKVFNPAKENELTDTVKAALNQIKDKDYDRQLLDSGVSDERIKHYGFAFQGKKVLIGS